MTEAAIITIAIVAGIVGLFWVVIHYAYKLQANERRQRQRGGDYSVQVQTGGLSAPEVLHRLGADNRRYFDVN